ncbi:DUF695 domain-containing protein [Hymenobacter sp. APR13]|uniref:DUF695 domain-containing protein n=1 Tax=Hymenobacter sp. APR13 TaxID=1356852 RepID=UPI0004E06DE4|nr:DUF695 domain-containing protein [Hymenobacter sp. APR13]AII53489.1 hypothetical protein N008_16085 [Hymenobacter sp. APR13]
MTLPSSAALSARYTAFWHWFSQHEQAFFRVVQEGTLIPEDFFALLTPALDEVREGFYFQTGMLTDDTAELVFSAEGALDLIGLVEELVAAAPALPGWKFTALKTASDISGISINMAGFEFNADTLHFYPNDDPAYPDEISLVLVHPHFTEADSTTVRNGALIFLETYLGELGFATSIDQITVTGPADAQQPLIAITKLQDYLLWRQKEFIEKYEGQYHGTTDDTYTSFQAELGNGNKLFAIMNTDLLAWEAKASHPWIVVVMVTYEDINNSGMPDDETYALLDTLEDELLAELPDIGGYLNLGRQTADSQREIYFACRDFRKPSKVLYLLQTQYASTLEVTYEIYKDKYWQSFERFGVA